LQETEEELAPRSGRPSVETKRVFIQVVVQVLAPDRPLVGTEQPPLHQGGDTVNPGQEPHGSILILFAHQYRDIVLVPNGLQASVRRKAIRMNDAARLDGCLYEPV
jgi:hypothetical protein